MKQPGSQISKGPYSAAKYQMSIIGAVGDAAARNKNGQKYMTLKEIALYIDQRSNSDSFKKYLKLCVDKGWLIEINDIKEIKKMFARNSGIPNTLKHKRIFVLTSLGAEFHASLNYVKYEDGMDMLKALFNAKDNDEVAEKIRNTTTFPNYLKHYSKVYDD